MIKEPKEREFYIESTVISFIIFYIKILILSGELVNTGKYVIHVDHILIHKFQKISYKHIFIYQLYIISLSIKSHS